MTPCLAGVYPSNKLLHYNWIKNVYSGIEKSAFNSNIPVDHDYRSQQSREISQNSYYIDAVQSSGERRKWKGFQVFGGSTEPSSRWIWIWYGYQYTVFTGWEWNGVPTSCPLGQIGFRRLKVVETGRNSGNFAASKEVHKRKNFCDAKVKVM